MRAVAACLLWGVAGQLGASPQGDANPSEAPSEHPPSSKVADSHRYYNLSVYQNNAGGTFDDNFIDMESAVVKQGKLQFLSKIPKSFKTSLLNHL